MTNEPRRYGRDEVAFARALTFFDAIYAFALTLLITTVNDFSLKAWSSPRALWDANGPALTSFAISFLVVVRFWRGSHSELATFSHLDNRLITLQTLVVFGIILLPFSTEALGEPAITNLPLPVAVYAVNVAGTYLLHSLFLIVADRSGTRERWAPAQMRFAVATAIVVPGVFLASIPVAYLSSPKNAELSWLSLFFLVPLAQRLARRATASPASEAAHSPRE